MKILLNTRGKIMSEISNSYIDWFILIKRAGGGYQMFLDHPIKKHGFNEWFLSYEDLEQALKKRNFKINWEIGTDNKAITNNHVIIED